MSDGWLFWKGMTVKQRVLGSPSGVFTGLAKWRIYWARQAVCTGLAKRRICWARQAVCTRLAKWHVLASGGIRTKKAGNACLGL